MCAAPATVKQMSYFIVLLKCGVLFQKPLCLWLAWEGEIIKTVSPDTGQNR